MFWLFVFYVLLTLRGTYHSFEHTICKLCAFHCCGQSHYCCLVSLFIKSPINLCSSRSTWSYKRAINLLPFHGDFSPFPFLFSLTVCINLDAWIWIFVTSLYFLNCFPYPYFTMAYHFFASVLVVSFLNRVVLIF